MEDQIATSHGTDERGQVEAITPNQFKLRVLQRATEKFTLPRGKIVETDDSFSIFQKTVNEVAADKTSRAGDKNSFHVKRTELSHQKQYPPAFLK
jgi:hypothetical protein